MQGLSIANIIICGLFTVCYAYQFIYLLVSLFGKEKPLVCEDKKNNFAVLICARNEAEVISDLIDSIKDQTYPSELIHTFVIADNCTDNTADIARACGAVVYERHDMKNIGKGFALDALLTAIKNDYPEGFDGYIVFDADNILKNDFIEKINHTFSYGYDIVTSYRNSKNYDSNWISAGYALWFIRDNRTMNFPRNLLGTSCAVSGTGFLFSRKVEEEMGTWPYHMLIEDVQFSVDQILKGYKIGYAREAELFDEQPVTFSQSWKQRMRWARGYLQLLSVYGGRMIKSAINGKFACFDLIMNFMPAFILTGCSIICNVALGIIGACNERNIGLLITSILIVLVSICGPLLILSIITTITEWKHIHTSTAKKIFFMITFPFFMITYVPVAVASLFTKAKWEPIEHNLSIKKLGTKGSELLKEAKGNEK